MILGFGVMEEAFNQLEYVNPAPVIPEAVLTTCRR